MSDPFEERGYVKTLDRGDTSIYHLDGVDWYDAPKPRRFHRCWPQSMMWEGFSCVERCACGAIRLNPHHPWMERNSRKKK